MSKQLHYRVLAMVVVYAILKFMGGSFGHLVLYPVTLLVTFLHEFGHALGAILTGGMVKAMQINADGSGYTVSNGGNPGVILMGGYLGSAILGNLLFRIGVKHKALTQGTLIALGVLMILAGLLWFESFESTGILIVFGISLYLIARKTNWDQDVIIFLGIAAVLYIIQDFNVGPKSDLAMYEQFVGIFPAQVWMYIWLVFAGLLFWMNLREIYKRR
ncbi:MAG: M50 family metallopeptidase [Saprospiraceae bacterium]|nr:M50 family metallopeptidase [Saprospiraceae bacterium]MCB9345835.1 M50 family metallopeptidase [Lewinellaceae bacterium]